MSRTIRVTTLVENTARGRKMLGEHGLAFWIETDSHRICLDTGQGMTLAHNARQLDIDLASADSLVLSHGHYDHTGAMADVLGRDRSTTVYVHSAAFQAKYARNPDGTARSVGVTSMSLQEVQDRARQIVWTDKPTEIAPGIYTTGEVPRQNDFEDTGGDFFLDEACTTPDPIRDDQSVFFSTPEGTVILLGCAHSGVVNTLNYVSNLTGNQPIHTVAGGMHLGSASPHRMARTLDALRKWNITSLRPAHCTFFQATCELSRAFGERCCPCQVATTMEFELSGR